MENEISSELFPTRELVVCSIRLSYRPLSINCPSVSPSRNAPGDESSREDAAATDRDTAETQRSDLALVSWRDWGQVPRASAMT